MVRGRRGTMRQKERCRRCRMGIGLWRCQAHDGSRQAVCQLLTCLDSAIQTLPKCASMRLQSLWQQPAGG